jgi:hypothetical protein
MLRLAFVSVLLLSVVAASQTALPVGTPLPDSLASSTPPSSCPGQSPTADSSSLPDAPSASFGSPNKSDRMGDTSGSQMAPTAMAVEPSTNRRPHTLDRKFILLHSLSTVALLTDLETTARGIAATPKAAELNPLFGAHPTRARLYGIAVPLDALSFYLSYRAKKNEPKRSLWIIGPGVSIAVHSAAAINNLIAAHR